MLLGAWVTGNVGTKPRTAQHSERRGRCKFSAVGGSKATVLQVFRALGALPSPALPSTVESLSCGAIMDPAVGDPWAPVGEGVPDLSSSKVMSDWWSPPQPHRPVHLYAGELGGGPHHGGASEKENSAQGRTEARGECRGTSVQRRHGQQGGHGLQRPANQDSSPVVPLSGQGLSFHICKLG